MTSRRKIYAQLLAADQQLKIQQTKVFHHKKKLHSFLADKRLFMIAAIPALLITWKFVKVARLGPLLRSGLRLIALTAVAQLRSQLLFEVKKVIANSLR